MNRPEPFEVSRVRASGNRFNRAELAGAFGDLGTLIPFVVAYSKMLGIEPVGMLFALRLRNGASGEAIWTKSPQGARFSFWWAMNLVGHER